MGKQNKNVPPDLRVIPVANRRVCFYCGETVDTSVNSCWQRGTAWFKRQAQTGSHNRAGTNAARGVKWIDEYACRECMDKMAKGIPSGQMGLWDDA